MSYNKRYNVMAPVKSGRDEKTVWVKVGNAFADPSADYDLKVFLLALPVSEPGKAIELFLYPEKEKAT